METLLTVCDNTETRGVKCIHVLGGSAKKFATIGDFIVIAIQRRRVWRRINVKKVCLGLVTRVKKEYRRPNGSYILGNMNMVLLLSELGKPLGTQIWGPVYYEFKTLGLDKLMARFRGVV